MSQLLVPSIMGILKMRRNRCLFAFHTFHCLGNRPHCRVALRSRCHVKHGLGQNNLCLRHPDPLHCLGCRYRHGQSHRVCVSHILRCADHDSAGNKPDILSGIKHLCQIVHRSVRVGSPHAFDKGGYGIIMVVPVLIVTDYSFLDTLGYNIQCQMNEPVTASFGSQNGKLHRIERQSGIATRHICQKCACIRIDPSVIASHSLLLIVDSPVNQAFHILLGQRL